MMYGYAPVSTEGQDLAAQLDRLRAAGCEKVFHEKASGKNAERPQIKRMLAALAPGDVVLATVTDRIARDPVDILRTVRATGAGLRLLDEPFIDTTNEMVDMVMFNVGWAVPWMRKSILRNTADGRARAKARSVRLGRKPKLTLHQQREARARLAKGEESTREIALSYGVSHQTISRLRPKTQPMEDTQL